MEKSCDEAVVRNLSKRGYTMESTKRAYGKMLFALGGGKQFLFTPVSFAENDTKERIVNIMKYKRNGMLTTALVIALCVSILVGCGGNPQDGENASQVIEQGAGTQTDEEMNDVKTFTIGDIEFTSDVTELGLNFSVIDLDDVEVIDISDLQYCTNLRSLSISGVEVLDFSPLQQCTQLSRLSCTVPNTPMKSEDLAYLSELTSLVNLDIMLDDSVTDISSLGTLSNLEDLSIGYPSSYKYGTKPICDISAISNLTNLHTLVLAGALYTNLDALAALPKLEDLTLASQYIEDISPLVECKNIAILCLSECHAVKDFSVLGEMDSVLYLNIIGTTLTDVNFTLEMENLLDFDYDEHGLG